MDETEEDKFFSSYTRIYFLENAYSEIRMFITMFLCVKNVICESNENIDMSNWQTQCARMKSGFSDARVIITN